MATTYSAGTFVSYICRICDEGGENVAVQYANTPHPEYLNEKGDVVIQTQMVELSGPNGVNS